MKLLNREIKLVIFDLDGTLLDSTYIWSDIDREFFARRGLELPIDFFDQICHLGLTGAAKYTINKYHLNEKEEDIIKEWRDASIRYYRDIIQLKPHAKEFLEYLKNNDVILSLATVNDEMLYKPCLERLGILKYFSLVKDVNSIKVGKESPKLYESINEHFNIKKENTAIFEDIVLGLKTAHDNGYLTIAVDDDATKDTYAEKKANSNYYIFDFLELIK